MMALMWLGVGFIVGFSVFIASWLHSRFELDWRAWAGLVLGEVMVLFCIAWSVAAMFEGEPRAASMGLMLFGAPGVAVLALTFRLLIASVPRRVGD
jgi:hypothetical protein